MKSLFKQLIIDFQEIEIPKPKRRDLQLPVLPLDMRKVWVFIGMRRSGKTWFLYQLMHEQLEKSLPKNKILYINFEDDRLSDIKGQDLATLLDAYFELYPEYMNDKNLHFFFDEIHEVDNWEKFIRRILDSEKINIYLTGSSAKMLSKEIATSLRGRTLVREIFPFGFQEYLDAKHVLREDKQFISSKQRAMLCHHLDHFLYFGGFPETLETSESLHRELLQGYMDSVIYRDIVERYHIKNATLVKVLLRFCLQNSASSISIHKMYQSLKSMGHAISKDTLYQWMKYFEDAYCVFMVQAFDFSSRKVELLPKKIYCVDQGLITAFTIKLAYEHASRFETAVFSKLRRTVEEVYYYRLATGQEIDFLTRTPDGVINLYQVCVSLENDKTKEREISALRESMKVLNIQKSTIVTLDQEQDIVMPEGMIHVIPAWRFL